MKRTLVAAGLLLGIALGAGPALAQSGAVRGKVVDAEGKPVVDARIVIDFQGGVTRKFETKSNKKGDFMQVGLPSGNYKFTIGKEGFKDFVFRHKIELGDPTDLPPIKLAPGVSGGGDPEAAKKAQEQLQKSFAAAVELTNAKKYEEAEAAYKALLTQRPNLPEAYQNLGYIYRQKKDYAAAEEAYKKVLELRSDSSDAMLGLSALYQEMNRPEDARAMLDKATSLNPADAGAQYRRGIYLLNANQNEEAMKAFQAAVAADPNMADAYFRLGTVLVGQGKIPEAVEQLEKYLSLNPTDTQNVATAQGLIKALKK